MPLLKFKLRLVLIAFVLAAMGLGFSYEFNFGNTNGIPKNALTRQAEPVVEAFKTGDPDKIVDVIARVGVHRDEVRSFVEIYRLPLIRAVTWTNVTYQNGPAARLDGKARLADGSSLDLTLKFDDRDGSWGLKAIRATGPVIPPSKSELPSWPSVLQLTNTTMSAILQAARTKSFIPIYNISSNAMKNTKTLAQFTADAGPLFQWDVTGDPTLEHVPIFKEPPSFTAEGFLVLRGHYEFGAVQVPFAFAYIFESDAWRLASFTVKTQAAPAANAMKSAALYQTQAE